MTYGIRLSREAQRDLENLATADRKLFTRVRHKIDSLADFPRAGKPLVGDHHGEFSLRIGSYRIVYEVLENVHNVFILTVKHRKHVY